MPLLAHGQTLVTISDTLRNADNTLASGRLEISWPALKTADGFTVAAGRKNYTVTAGVVNLQLFPNAGATPSCTSYTVDYYLTSGAGREYWVVPAAGPVTIAGIRVSVAPTPSVLVSQNQLALGTGLNVLLGLSRWASGAQPAATAGGQCYYDTTADLMKCSNNALAYAPTGGIQSLNSLTAATQSISTGTSGSDFNISSLGNTHTFNLPNASATARGVVSTATQSFSGLKNFDTTDSTANPTVALVGILRATHASGSKPWSQGMGAESYNLGPGAVTELAALGTYAEQNGSGSVTNMYGVLINPNARFSGTVTNNYGILVADQGGVGTNNWAIRTFSGKVEFGDQVVAKNINAVRYANQFTGADACAKIAAAIADLPSSGGTVDARGLEGAQTCASNPLAGVAKSVVLLLGSATYTIDAQWIIPGAVTIRGQHPATTDGTIIKASASFPTATALLRLGSRASGFTHRARVENLQIDCNGKASAIGVLSENAAENSGVYGSLINNCPDAGVKISGANAQFWSLEDLEIGGSTGAASTTNGIEIDNALGGTIRRVTVNPGGLPLINAAVYLNNASGVLVQDIHGEYVTTVVQLGDATAVTGITVDGASGSSNGADPDVSDVVKIANLAGTTGPRISGIKKLGSTNSINDGKSGITLSEDSIGLYTIGNARLAAGTVSVLPNTTDKVLLGGLGSNFGALGFASTLTGTNYALSGDGVNTLVNVAAGNLDFRSSNTTMGRMFPGGGLYWGQSPADPGVNHLRVQGNLQTKSDTAFVGILDHAITADRTWTLPDAGGNIPALPTAATTETGSGAVVRQTSPSLTSPTLAGTPVVGDGAGNDKLEFAEEATNPACAAGNFFIWANSADNKLKKCQNGTISDLDTSSAGGGYDTAKGDTGTATKTGSEALKIQGTSGEISTVAADGSPDDTVTLSLPATLSTAKTVSGGWTFNTAATLFQGSAAALRIDLENPDTPADNSFADSPEFQITGIRDSDAGAGITREEINWKLFSDVTAVAGTSSLVLQSRIGAGAFTERAKFTDGGVLDVATGFRIGGAAATGNYLRGNGTNFVSAAIASGDLPSTVVRTDQGNTYTTGAQDFGSATSLKVPTSAGAAPTASGLLAYDSTSNTLEYGENGANRTLVHTARTLTGGAGIAAIGDLSADRTIFTASDEADFLAVSTLTCGAGTKGKASIPSANLTYCDNSGTPTLRTVVNDNRSLTGGTGISTIGDLSADRTISIDATEFTGLTFLAGSDSTWTFDTTGGTSPVLSFTGATINVSTGTLQEGGVAVSLPARTETLTNKTLDVEGTGNSITTVEKIWIPGATCVGATATLNWDDDPAVAEPTAACVAGTNITKGVADFLDSASNAMQTHIKLPSDWTGNMDVKLVWFSTATTGSAVWQVATICAADAETDDPSFNTASTVTDATKGTANQLNDATITGITTTGCAAGELLHLRLLRDPAHASDNLGATARFYGMELTLRRTQ